MRYLKGILILNNIGVFKLFQDSDFLTNFLLGNELAIHLFNGDLFASKYILPFVNLPKGALANAIFFSEDVVSHLYLYLVIHSFFIIFVVLYNNYSKR